MFKKFNMSTTAMEYGIYQSESVVDILWGQEDSTRPLEEGDRTKAETWFGCRSVELWKSERSPYYRIYPGVMEAMLKLNLDKLLDVGHGSFPFGLKTISLEIPSDYWDELDCTSLIIVDCKKYYGITHQRLDGSYGYNLVDLTTLRDHLKRFNSITHKFTQIIFGVLAIGDNSDIVKPVVLKTDEKKYQLTGDEKYIEKARRRGVFGFEIGEDIPTKAQLKQMIKENEIAIEQGRKAPHIRSACLALVHTGKGRSLPKIIKRKGCFVNKDLLTKIPQGFYEE